MEGTDARILCDPLSRSLHLGSDGRNSPEPVREALRLMIRAIFGEALLFFVPFAIFALYLVLRRRNPFQWAAWSDQTAWLVIAGLGLAVLALLYTGLTA